MSTAHRQYCDAAGRHELVCETAGWEFESLPTCHENRELKLPVQTSALSPFVFAAAPYCAG
jgi:hypothetical protein